MPGPFASPTWTDEIIQLLDEHHLVMLSDIAAVRDHCASSLVQRLTSMSDTQVIDINGTGIRDLPGFSRALEIGLDVDLPRASAWWRDVMSVIAALRASSG